MANLNSNGVEGNKRRQGAGKNKDWISSKRQEWSNLGGKSLSCDWWNYEPKLGRVVSGIPSKLDENRIKALGNAIVPACVMPIMWAIREIEEQ